MALPRGDPQGAPLAALLATLWTAGHLQAIPIPTSVSYITALTMRLHQNSLTDLPVVLEHHDVRPLDSSDATLGPVLDPR